MLAPLPRAPARSVWDPRGAGALLHECHAAHASYGAADEHAQAMVQLYGEWAREVAGLPAVAGRRSPSGTMRGAAATYTVEALVGGGRALQVGGWAMLASALRLFCVERLADGAWGTALAAPGRPSPTQLAPPQRSPPAASTATASSPLPRTPSG